MFLGTLIGAAGLFAGCDSDHNRHLENLSAAGIEPSGRALLEAVAAGNHDHIDWLLRAGVHTGQRDASGRSPLRIALERRDLRTVFKLIDAGADVNSSTPDGVSVLGVALATGETAVCSKLLEKGARTHGHTPDGGNIMPHAIRGGHLAFIRALMASSIDPHQTDPDGNPLLHIAIASGRRAIAESLIELGADSGMRNPRGETTIHLALRQGWADLVPELAAAGADPNAAAEGELSLLEQAAAAGDLENISFLLKIGADPGHASPMARGRSPLHAALEDRNLALIRLFLDAAPRPAARDWQQWLERAFESRDLELTRTLLARGARGETTARGGLTLMEKAVGARSAAFVSLFLNYGFPAGRSLENAVENGDHLTASLLLEAGLNPDVTRAPRADNLLTKSIKRRGDRMALLLLRHGADPAPRAPGTQSAFHLAVATGCPLTVKHLLDAGTGPDTPLVQPVSPDFIRHVRPGVMRWILRNDRNVTPLMIAADSGNLAVARHLLDAGAKRSVWTRSARLWPINFAARRGDVRMMRLILGQDPAREERHIVVKISEQKAWLYDAEGNELFSTRVSTGKKAKPTPTGEFVITNKHRTWTSTIFHSSMPYFQRLNCSDFGLHQGYVPGYPASSGCIRIPPGNAAKLFSLTLAGDRVSILP